MLAATAALLLGCPPAEDEVDDDVGDDDVGGDDDTSDDDTSDDDTADDDDLSDDDTEVPMEIPPVSGVTCADTEPNDCAIDGWGGEWGTCAQDCSPMVTGDGLADEITGSLSTIVHQTWDGDNDTHEFVIEGPGYLNGVLDWDDVTADLDWYMVCFYEDEFNEPGWYSMCGDLVDLSKPEQGTSLVAMPSGTMCYAWIVGYEAVDGEPYTLHMWMTPP